jgi:hypothetical protein
VKPGDRVSFAPSNMIKRPNPVANDAYIVSSPGDLTARAIPEPTAQSFATEEDDTQDESDFVFWRRCPICPGVVASSLDEWETHLAGEEHGAALRARAKATAAPVGTATVTGPPPGLSAPVAAAFIVKGGPVLPVGGKAGAFAAPSQSRFSFAQQPDSDPGQAPGWPATHKHGTVVPAAPGLTLVPPGLGSKQDVANQDQKHQSDQHQQQKQVAASSTGQAQQQVGHVDALLATNANNTGNNNNKPIVGVGAQTLVLPRHSPDEPLRVTVAYRNNFVMEYEFPDVSIPVAVLRRAPSVDVIRRQWLVQRLEVVMGEMDEQLPRAAFQNR